MNLLVGREKSIVTNIAGTTRDVVEDTVLVGNVMLKLSDTAGIRDTDNEIEKIGVQKPLIKSTVQVLLLHCLIIMKYLIAKILTLLIKSRICLVLP